MNDLIHLRSLVYWLCTIDFHWRPRKPYKRWTAVQTPGEIFPIYHESGCCSLSWLGAMYNLLNHSVITSLFFCIAENSPPTNSTVSSWRPAVLGNYRAFFDSCTTCFWHFLKVLCFQRQLLGLGLIATDMLHIQKSEIVDTISDYISVGFGLCTHIP